MDADDIIILGFLFVVFVGVAYLVAIIISVHCGCVIIPVAFDNITVDRIANNHILDTNGEKWRVSNDDLDLQLIEHGTNITVVRVSNDAFAKVVKIEGKAI